MTNVNIFLASSYELNDDRIAFGNFIRRLDNHYEGKGYRIKLFIWEDFDAADNRRRKQDEYNEYLEKSDIVFVLYKTKAGEYTVEEMEASLKITTPETTLHHDTYILFKEPTIEELMQQSVENKEKFEKFKSELPEKYKRTVTTFQTKEELHLFNLIVLQLSYPTLREDVIIEQGWLKSNGMKIARVKNLPFLANNIKFNSFEKSFSINFPISDEKVMDIHETMEKCPTLEEVFKSFLSIQTK